MKNVEELKKQYNNVLCLLNRGNKFLDNPAIPEHEKDMAIPKFKGLIDKANKLIAILESCGVAMDAETILNGFKEVEP